jgi:proline iminopeptidase
VNDLREIIHSLQLEKFHLLGHSFGGIVAYEFAKTKDIMDSTCLSLTLNSTPANMKTSLEEVSRLEAEIRRELQLGSYEGSKASSLIRDRLRKRNECRIEEMPEPLQAAIEGRGTLFGPEAVSDYVAYPPLGLFFPPVLVIRGQYDFISEVCIQGWRDIFGQDTNSRGNAYREETIKNCAHYCHLEDAKSFGDLVKRHLFINDY